MKFHPASIQIEGLDGKRVPLRFMVPYFVFPGQTIAVQGTNPTGNIIDVHRFYDVCSSSLVYSFYFYSFKGSYPPPYPVEEDYTRARKGLQIFVAQGPFWPLTQALEGLSILPPFISIINTPILSLSSQRHRCTERL